VYIFHGRLVYFSRFGMLLQEKSGNPVPDIERDVVCEHPRAFAEWLIIDGSANMSVRK
jgi:hypothetical protein